MRILRPLLVLLLLLLPAGIVRAEDNAFPLQKPQPTLRNIPNQTVTAGEKLTFIVEAQDAENSNTVSIEMRCDIPGPEFDGRTFTWQTKRKSKGMMVSFIATDRHTGGIAVLSVNIEVLQPGEIPFREYHPKTNDGKKPFWKNFFKKIHF